ncbi:hypothetical protein OROHE_013436 [Orobanche hederae]
MDDDALSEMDIVEKVNCSYNSHEHDMANDEVVTEKEMGHEEHEFSLTKKHEEPKKGMSFDRNSV